MPFRGLCWRHMVKLPNPIQNYTAEAHSSIESGGNWISTTELVPWGIVHEVKTRECFWPYGQEQPHTREEVQTLPTKKGCQEIGTVGKGCWRVPSNLPLQKGNKESLFWGSKGQLWGPSFLSCLSMTWTSYSPAGCVSSVLIASWELLLLIQNLWLAFRVSCSHKRMFHGLADAFQPG